MDRLKICRICVFTAFSLVPKNTLMRKKLGICYEVGHFGGSPLG